LFPVDSDILTWQSEEILQDFAAASYLCLSMEAVIAGEGSPIVPA
jgi:hypothetical protein